MSMSVGILAWDTRVLLRVRRLERPWMTWTARALTRMGNASGWLLIAAVMALAGERTTALELVAAISIATLVVQPLKRLCRRARPTVRIGDFRALTADPDAFSFPSGHTAAAFAVAMAFAGRYPVLGPVAVLLAGSIAFARVYLGAHYPLDVAAGAIIGVGAGSAAVRMAPMLTPMLAHMPHAGSIAAVLGALSLVGAVLLIVQLSVLRFHLRLGPVLTHSSEGISILKPLCGLDDDLADNLAVFAHLDHPDYEVLLGLEHAGDAAVRVAREAVERWPDRFRLVFQEGAPGLNPKVNQLHTLTRHARHPIVVVSDSNARVPRHYLREIGALFADRSVGLVTHPVVGSGAATAGAACDALHLAAGVGMGQVASKRVSGQDIVVGKSMAMRKEDLAAMGGWAAVENVLAEDFVTGRLVATRLGKRVALAATPVQNLSRRRSMGDFFRRYARWSVMQRHSAGAALYASMWMLNPVAIALMAMVLSPSLRMGALVAGVVTVRIVVDALALNLLGERGLPRWMLLLAPVKDLVIAAAWAHGAFVNHVDWRGKRLLVTEGTRLQPMAPNAAVRAAA